MSGEPTRPDSIESGRLDVSLADPKLPLRALMHVGPQAYDRVLGCPVSVLAPSVRLTNCLAKAGITSLEQLLALNLEKLWSLRNMGHKSLQELADSLVGFLERGLLPESPIPADAVSDPNGKGSPLTLHWEWLSFSGTPVCPPELSISDLVLDVDCAARLEAAGVSTIDALLTWSLAELVNSIGPDYAEQVVSALSDLAWLYGNACLPSTLNARPGAAELSRMLTIRWADGQVTQLGLDQETLTVLRCAGISTLAQVLDALDSLHPTLYFDLAAFTAVWDALVSLGLRRGDALAARESLGDASQAGLSLDTIVQHWQGRCTAREWRVLGGRFGVTAAAYQDDRLELVRAETLEELAVDLGLTRERVRQIEATAIRKVTSPSSPVRGLGRTLGVLLREAGGVLSLTDTATELAKLVRLGSQPPEAVCYLAYEVAGECARVERGAIYAAKDVPWPQYGQVIAAARSLWRSSTENLHGDNLLPRLMDTLAADGLDLSSTFVRACLRADGRFLDDGRRVRELGRNLNALIVDALRHLGRPAHFSEIAAELNARGWWSGRASAHSVHGRLTSHEELFVYVERGTYGLAEWGIEDRRDWDRTRDITIAELIERFLEERNEPASADEIVDYVQSQKQRREYSIQLCLSRDPRFHHFARGAWGLKKWVF